MNNFSKQLLCVATSCSVIRFFEIDECATILNIVSTQSCAQARSQRKPLKFSSGWVPNRSIPMSFILLNNLTVSSSKLDVSLSITILTWYFRFILSAARVGIILLNVELVRIFKYYADCVSICSVSFHSLWSIVIMF